jgi:hypothetical protein
VASLPQWTADQFWNQVQWVAAQGREQKARLDQQKLDLQNTYSAARAANDTAKMAALEPLIHQNSVLRLRWNDLRAGFNDLMGKARDFLAENGITEPPVLAALPAVVVPILWIAAAIAVIAIVHEIAAGIKAVDDALAKLGPVGRTAVALVPLALIAAAIYLVPMFMKRRAA